MGDYNFLADMLTTFRSSSDFIKALWLLSPALLVLALGAVLRWQPRRVKQAGRSSIEALTQEPDLLADGGGRKVFLELSKHHVGFNPNKPTQ